MKIKFKDGIIIEVKNTKEKSKKEIIDEAKIIHDEFIKNSGITYNDLEVYDCYFSDNAESDITVELSPIDTEKFGENIYYICGYNYSLEYDLVGGWVGDHIEYEDKIDPKTVKISDIDIISVKMIEADETDKTIIENALNLKEILSSDKELAKDILLNNSMCLDYIIDQENQRRKSRYEDSKSVKDEDKEKKYDYYFFKWHFEVYPDRDSRKYWLYSPNGLGGQLFYYGKGLLKEKTISWEGNVPIPEYVSDKIIRICYDMEYNKDNTSVKDEKYRNIDDSNKIDPNLFGEDKVNEIIHKNISPELNYTDDTLDAYSSSEFEGTIYFTYKNEYSIELSIEGTIKIDEDDGIECKITDVYDWYDNAYTDENEEIELDNICEKLKEFNIGEDVIYDIAYKKLQDSAIEHAEED